MEPDTSPLISFIRGNVFILALLCIGLIVFGFGLFQVLKPQSDPITLEKASVSDQAAVASIVPTKTEIMVDVEGAVVKPGVYSLPSTARVQDGITAAGGLSPKADHQSLAKGINLAAHLTDSAKLYIPFQGEQASINSTSGSVVGASTGSVSINNATSSELDSLPGVGPVTSGKIIANRPYNTLDELLSKKAVSKSVYDKIKDQISL